MQSFLSLVVVLWVYAPYQISTVSLNFVSVIIGDNPAYGHRAAAPFYDVSLTRLRKLYPILYHNLTEIVVYKADGPGGCPDAADLMYSVGAKVYDVIYDKQGYIVLYSPGKLCVRVTDKTQKNKPVNLQDVVWRWCH